MQPSSMPCRGRRGALLLLVLSMLTLFLMIGTLMIVLATRARTTARAFADATATGGSRQLEARGLLEKALMVLLRGQADGGQPGTVPESLLADRYGQGIEGTLTDATGQGSPLLQATITGVGGNPAVLVGRVVTFLPEQSDAAAPASYRIVDVQGTTFTLANLRSAVPSTLPKKNCRAVVNGRDFSGPAPNEPYDAFDAANPFLAQLKVAGNDGTITVQRPSFASAGGGQPEVDNDGDGVADGVWLAAVLPKRPAPGGGEFTYDVSYLVVDLDGRINLNTHGVEGGTKPGPADVDAGPVVPIGIWNRVLDGAPPGQFQGVSASQRRQPPVLRDPADGRFTGGNRSPYGLRLDFEGPRGRGLQSGRADGNLYSFGELERILRQFDRDASTLPPRLAAVLDSSAQAVRMLVTTDSWDTPGLTGPTAATVLAKLPNPNPDLPREVRMGLRFMIDRTLDDDDSKQAFFEEFYAVVVAAGVPGPQAAQWVANVIDFCDADLQKGQYELPGGAGGNVQGAEPEPVALGRLGTSWNTGKIRSPADLLAIPKDSPTDLEQRLRDNNLLGMKSLAVEHPEILEAVTVSSPFAGSVNVGPANNPLCQWREPGRVNVNTCNERVFEGLLRENQTNPFQNTPARSSSQLLLAEPLVFASNARDILSVNRDRAERLATSGTVRSNVFAVWITLKVTSADPNQEPSLHRLFAIIDRSIPVAYLTPGQDLNARDAVRVLKHLE